MAATAETLREWDFEGLHCRVVRMTERNDSWLCGYVELPKTHPLYEREYFSQQPTHIGRLSVEGPWEIGIDSGFADMELDVFCRQLEQLAHKLAIIGQ